MWSRNWNNITVLASEVAVALDLAATVVHNMKGFDEGKLITCTDCSKVWELLTTKVLKASQLAGDGGSIVSKIIELHKNRNRIRVHAY